MEVGKAAYRAFLPSSRHNKQSAKFAHLNTGLGETPSPWGWAGAEGARRAKFTRSRKPARSRAPQRKPESDESVPWGWPGSEGVKRSNMEIITEGIEKSAAVASVKNVLNRESDSASDDDVGWPYRSDDKKPPKRPARYVGGAVGSSKRNKPWGW
jgi:hypothetical protein